MELAAASEMSLGYRVDKQPTWHPIWRARYRVAVDCRPEVPVPRSNAGLRVIVVFPGERAFGARLLSDTALLRRQLINASRDVPYCIMSLQYFV